MENNKQQLFTGIQKEIGIARKSILDGLEMAFGDHPKWQQVRTFVLRSLGTNGLEGSVGELLGLERNKRGNL